VVAIAADVPPTPAWEAANPVKPLPQPPLGITGKFSDLKVPPKPETVRLGRWLYFDKRLSSDGSISCATCHRPENAFSEPTPVSTGIRGQKGNRKAPPSVNLAWTIYPHFFWDGRAASLEDQALGPVENPVEMGNTHEAMIATISKIDGYAPYFKEAFGSPEITKDRIAKALADYERTRLSGNSAFDQWQEHRFDDGFKPTAKQEQLAKGFELFNGKAQCNQCHLGQNFTDSLFHNLGIGWDAGKKDFADIGRSKVSNKDEDKGAFKTPTLREVTKHAPYMHDGSLATLRDVVEHYNKGGNPNPWMSKKIQPLNLSKDEVDLLVSFMESLDGEGYMDTAPVAFPQ
jgi:cytochrome c peroxidase